MFFLVSMLLSLQQLCVYSGTRVHKFKSKSSNILGATGGVCVGIDTIGTAFCLSLKCQ